MLHHATGFWPYPFSADSLERAQDAVDAFQSGLEAHPYYLGFNFNTSFSNGSATANLPGILITPDRSKPLPLIIITGGTDFPKEVGLLVVPAYSKSHPVTASAHSANKSGHWQGLSCPALLETWS